jgi:hypothetical protein
MYVLMIWKPELPGENAASPFRVANQMVPFLSSLISLYPIGRKAGRVFGIMPEYV